MNPIMGHDKCKQITVPINMMKAHHDVNLIGISFCLLEKFPRK